MYHGSCFFNNYFCIVLFDWFCGVSMCQYKCTSRTTLLSSKYLLTVYIWEQSCGWLTCEVNIASYRNRSSKPVRCLTHFRAKVFLRPSWELTFAVLELSLADRSAHLDTSNNTLHNHANLLFVRQSADECNQSSPNLRDICKYRWYITHTI